MQKERSVKPIPQIICRCLIFKTGPFCSKWNKKAVSAENTDGVAEAFADRKKEFKKSKKVPTSVYRLREGAEPKLLAVREMLTVYRDVYLKNKDLRGTDLLEKVHVFYLGRKRRAKVPTPLLPDKYGDKSVAMRNMRRYISKAERVMLNVANGQFPGKY